MSVKFILPLFDLSATVHFFKRKINSRLTPDGSNIVVAPEDPGCGSRDKPEQQSGDPGYPAGVYPEDGSEWKAAETEQFQMPYIQGRYSRGRNPDSQRQF